MPQFTVEYSVENDEKNVWHSDYDMSCLSGFTGLKFMASSPTDDRKHMHFICELVIVYICLLKYKVFLLF